MRSDLRAAVRRSAGALALAVSFASCAPVAPKAPPAAPARAPLPFALADLWAVAAPGEAARTLEGLARYLALPEFSQEEKARALFRWVAANVRYDLAAFRSGEVEPVSPEAVLERRTAVCDGYSGLYAALAQAAGLQAVTVRGFAKGVGYEAGAPVPALPNHAWNAVRVEDRWLLLDCTWAAGVLDERGEYEAGFDAYFFDVAPAQLALTHFPLDPRWQLLARPITRAEFEGLPYVKTAFFKCGLGFDGARTARIRTAQPLVRVSLFAPADTHVIASLVRGEEEMRKGRIAVRREEGGRVAVWALVPEPGSYTLRIFARRGDPDGIYAWAADYAVDASAGDRAGTVDAALARAGKASDGQAR